MRSVRKGQGVLELVEQLDHFQQFCILFRIDPFNLRLDLVQKTFQLVDHVHLFSMALAVGVESDEDPFSAVNHVEVVVA